MKEYSNNTIFRNILNTSSIRRISFRNDLNGLRAIAVIAVVLYHSEFTLFKGGWLGVDMFFVISGFLISNIIISELNTGTFSFKSFYLRRIKRILPALFTTLITTTPLAYFLLSSSAMTKYLNSYISSIFFYSNYYFENLDFYNTEPTKYMPLLHTWSLAIEEQFYIVFPLFIFLIFKLLHKYIFTIVFLIFSYSVLLNFNLTFLDIFYKFEYRIWELLLGVLLMIISDKYQNKNSQYLGIMLLSFPIFYFDDSQINSVLPKIICLLGVSMFINSSKSDTLAKKILRSKPFFRIGLYSYSIYLIHVPAFAFYRIYKLNNLQTITIFESILLICFIIVLSSFSFNFIEKKFIKGTFGLQFLFVLFIITGLSYLFLQTNENSKFTNQEIRSYISQISDIEKNTLYVDGQSCHNRKLAELCVFENNSNRNVIILGDSSFRSLTKYFGENSKELDINLTVVTGSSCLFLYHYNTSEASCPSFDKNELDYFVSNINNSIIIYGGRLPAYITNEGFDNGIIKEEINFNGNLIDYSLQVKNTLIQLERQNNMLIVVYPIPEQGWNVPNLFKNGNFQFGDSVGYDYTLFKNRASLSYEIYDSIVVESIIRIYPENLFCNSYVEDKCLGAYRNIIFYSDDDHLSIEGGTLLGNLILSELRD